MQSTRADIGIFEGWHVIWTVECRIDGGVGKHLVQDEHDIFGATHGSEEVADDGDLWLLHSLIIARGTGYDCKIIVVDV